MTFDPADCPTADDVREALRRAIDVERVRVGEEPGEPYSAREWDAAAATVVAMCVLRAPFARRRAVLMQMQLDFLHDGYFCPAGSNDTL